MRGESPTESVKSRFDTIPGDPPCNQPSVKPNTVAFWTLHPEIQACDKCQAMEGIKFKKKPERPHPNCKCVIRKNEYRSGKYQIAGFIEGFGDSATQVFAGLGCIKVRVANMGRTQMSGVRIYANCAGE